jgi:hypothetical protein
MKKIFYSLSTIVILFFLVPSSYGQLTSSKELMKQRKELRAQIKDKAVKQARKEAARLEKEEGWRVFPGDKPLEKMLEEAWMKQYEMKLNPDMSETNAYIWAVGTAVAKTKEAAKMQAMERAKVELAGQLQTNVAALTSSNIANAQLSGVDAETEQSIVQTAKNITSAKLTMVKPTVLIYRTKIPRKELKKNNKQQLSPGSVEVQVIMFYDLYQADLQTREAIIQELKDKLNKSEEELKKLMGM